MRIILIIILSLFLIASSFWGSMPKETGIWVPLSCNSNGLYVSWQDKYGELHGDSCTCVWENTSEFLLTSKTARKTILEKMNINWMEYK